MAAVNIYLTFDGNCKEAFDYYKSVFGGEYPYAGTFGEMPPQEGMPPMTEDDKRRIMHISLPVSKETILMGSDIVSFSPKITVGNNFSISVNAASRDEADKIFAGLSAGGTITMPLNKTFWGAYFGMCTDKFGINWMMNFDESPQK